MVSISPPARLAFPHRRTLQRLGLAGGVVTLTSALATMTALAAEPDDGPTVAAPADALVLPDSGSAAEPHLDLVSGLDARQGLLEAVSEADDAIAQQRARQAARQAAAEQEAAEQAAAQEAAEEAAAQQAQATEPTDEEPEPANDGAVSVATWDRVAECESNGDWSINTGNGFYGGLQFEQRSWEWVGGSGAPHEASKQEQIHRAEMLLERQGWEAWPACSRQLGLR